MTDRCVFRVVIGVLAFALSVAPPCALAQLHRLPSPPPTTLDYFAPSQPATPSHLIAQSPFDREPTLDARQAAREVPVPGQLHGTPSLIDSWSWQLMPEGLMYRSYLAGVKEPRLASTMIHDEDLGWVWDHNIGARVAFIRFGSQNELRPEGWQMDVEASTYLRQDPEDELDVVASDFRIGTPLTYAEGPIHVKFSYYHTSSHVGDEFQLKNPAFRRINYLRDALTFGIGYYVTDSLRLYAEADWAFNRKGGADPITFQIGADYSPCNYSGWRGTPFFAINGYLREELDFGGSLNVQTGWQWRSRNTGRLFRIGVQYYNGSTPLFEFFNRHEELIGMGLWYDF